jgi:hypothetical protein
MICANPNCGQLVNSDASFCGACGTPTKKSEAASFNGLDQTTPGVQPKPSDLEELKKQKEYLLLQREIAQLEGKSSLGNRVNRWSWKWVAPLGLMAAFGLFVCLTFSPYDWQQNTLDCGLVAIFSLVAICPTVLKIFKFLHVIG